MGTALISRLGIQGTGRSLGVAACVSALLAVGSPLSAAGQESDAGSGKYVVFDIPAQPLAVSLASFGAATRVSVLVGSDLTAGRKSAALRGSFTPEEALGRLLDGTGLVIQVIGPGAITLAEAPPAPVREPPPFTDYATAIQTAVMTALCGRSETKPVYQTVIRLWLDPTGVVTHVELATSTGSAGLDDAIAATLQNIDIGTPPPGMPRLVKLAVLPRPEGDTGCSPAYLGNRSDGTMGSPQ